MNAEFTRFIGCDAAYEEAQIVVFGAPFDGTTSFRPGTRFAPNAMRQDSYGLETYSPLQEDDVSEYLIFDSGDLEIPIGNVNKTLAMVEQRTAHILRDHKIPCMIGGEHLLTLGCMKAMVNTYPDVHVLQFDAHCDLRDEYLGESLSHACVMRRIFPLLQPGNLHQFGIRSGEKQEFEFAKQHTDMHPFHIQDAAEIIAKLKHVPVYVTIDLDVLDPSILPGTGTPEPGGISFHDLQNMIVNLRDIHIVGADINELSPTYDQSGVSTAVANKVLRELLLAIGGKTDE